MLQLYLNILYNQDRMVYTFLNHLLSIHLDIYLNINFYKNIFSLNFNYMKDIQQRIQNKLNKVISKGHKSKSSYQQRNLINKYCYRFSPLNMDIKINVCMMYISMDFIGCKYCIYHHSPYIFHYHKTNQKGIQNNIYLNIIC